MYNNLGAALSIVGTSAPQADFLGVEPVPPFDGDEGMIKNSSEPHQTQDGIKRYFSAKFVRAGQLSCGERQRKNELRSNLAGDVLGTRQSPQKRLNSVHNKVPLLSSDSLKARIINAARASPAAGPPPLGTPPLTLRSTSANIRRRFLSSPQHKEKETRLSGQPAPGTHVASTNIRSLDSQKRFPWRSAQSSAAKTSIQPRSSDDNSSASPTEKEVELDAGKGKQTKKGKPLSRRRSLQHAKKKKKDSVRRRWTQDGREEEDPVGTGRPAAERQDESVLTKAKVSATSRALKTAIDSAKNFHSSRVETHQPLSPRRKEAEITRESTARNREGTSEQIHSANWVSRGLKRSASNEKHATSPIVNNKAGNGAVGAEQGTSASAHHDGIVVETVPLSKPVSCDGPSTIRTVKKPTPPPTVLSEKPAVTRPPSLNGRKLSRVVSTPTSPSHSLWHIRRSQSETFCRTFDPEDERKKAQERVDAWKRSKFLKRRSEEEAARKRQSEALEKRAQLNSDKERRRYEIYALNEMLRRSDEAQVAIFLSGKEGKDSEAKSGGGV